MIAAARRPVPYERSLVVGGAVVALLLAGLLAFALFDTVRQLHAMNAQLVTVGHDLGALDAMSRKLDRLAQMQTTLDRTNDKLDAANRRLDVTNRSLDAALTSLGSTQTKLGAMDAKLGALDGRMRGIDGDLRSMRGDIHVMAHKLGGSFLFRGVK